jgi:hypothetical protein
MSASNKCPTFFVTMILRSSRRAQTTRFKAAVTGAGDVEFVVNWGNNKFSLPYAYNLGGLPWEAAQNYNAEAPIWQIGKVTTPTHNVAGAEDITVYVGEDYLLERGLTT